MAVPIRVQSLLNGEHLPTSVHLGNLGGGVVERILAGLTR